MVRSAATGPLTVVVNCHAQRLETGSGAAFRGLVYPADVICYSPPVLETVRDVNELRALLSRLGIEDSDQVIGNAEKPAPVRTLLLPADELRRLFAGVDEGWFVM